jgi:hypothetical protein
MPPAQRELHRYASSVPASTIATRRPSSAPRSAAHSPANPPPIATRSNSICSLNRPCHYAGGASQELGVEREICTSSSVMSAGMSAKSGVLR